MFFVKAVLAFFWKTCFSIAMLLMAVLVPHDIVVFSAVRERIDRAIAGVDLSQARRDPAIRKAFNLDSPHFYLNEAFQLYREEYWARWERDQTVSFHGEKIPASLVWEVELWVWYDRASLETLRLRRWKTDTLAKAVFSKELHELTAYELECVAKFVRARYYRACPEMQVLR